MRVRTRKEYQLPSVRHHFCQFLMSVYGKKKKQKPSKEREFGLYLESELVKRGQKRIHFHKTEKW